jgi:hypothetical protein
LEDELKSQGKRLGDADLAEIDQIWNQIKDQTLNAQRSTSNIEGRL